ncbi:MAG: pilus assembly protein PilM [Thermodesulfobacteriota bacterium]|nr:pilus assembly protein PilM [Thermodesulfobacteriota bacterium]
MFDRKSAYLSGIKKGISLRDKDQNPLLNKGEIPLLIGELKDLLNKKDSFCLLGREVYLGISRDQVIIKFIELPKAALENLQSVLNFEMERYIPFSADNVYFDFLLLNKGSENQTIKVLLIVVPKNLMDKYLEDLETEGIFLNGVEISTTALLRAHMFLKPQSKEICLLIEVNQNHGEICVLKSGEIIYSRGLDFNESLSDKDTVHILEETVKQMERDLDGTEFSEIIISGTRNESNNLKDIFSKIYPGQDINFIPFSLTSYGLALKGIGLNEFNINLVPHLKNNTYSKSGLKITLILFVLLFLLLLGGLSGIFLKTPIELWKINRNLMEKKTAIINLDRKLNHIAEMDRDLEFFNNTLKKFINPLLLLKNLSEIIPVGNWVKEFDYKEGTAILIGEGTDCADLISILENSSYIREVEFLSPVTKNEATGKEEFKIRFKIE